MTAPSTVGLKEVCGPGLRWSGCAARIVVARDSWRCTRIVERKYAIPLRYCATWDDSCRCTLLQLNNNQVSIGLDAAPAKHWPKHPTRPRSDYPDLAAETNPRLAQIAFKRRPFALRTSVQVGTLGTPETLHNAAYTDFSGNVVPFSLRP